MKGKKMTQYELKKKAYKEFYTNQDDCYLIDSDVIMIDRCTSKDIIIGHLIKEYPTLKRWIDTYLDY